MTETKMVKAEESRPVRKSQAKARMKNMMMFLPNMVRLCGKLLMDGRVPVAEKALFAGAIVYAIMPLDFIPDVLPFIGQVDDVYLIALTLMRLISRTDESIVREHWSGGGDIISLTDSVAKLAPMLLPKRVTRVLSSKVELAPAAKNLQALAKNKESLVIEIPQPDTAE
ncbi:MAG TPA: YkvA family protein [Pyrinomonadaceae bacterium]